MIVTASEHGWRCITQPDHARLGRELLALWRRDGLPDHPRREALLEAVLEHDNGWREADAAPRLHVEEGRPHDFVSHPLAERLAIWRRGIERYRDDRPYVAALVLEHARYLHRGRRGVPAWDEFLDELESRRGELAAAAGLAPAELASDYRWLHTADLCSLVVCADWREPFERRGLRCRLREDGLELSPFPLAGATRFSVPCRDLPSGEYRSDAAVATALAACRWRRLIFRVVPPGVPGTEPESPS
ncbi:MAG: DUF3891 family protein [Acidobacteriota bacterium]|nr:DUF3891 family protein [Acidobacteriota bacterium]MDH3522445.1 DUF3891 family protein [Acidobacteriota bacterium]